MSNININDCLKLNKNNSYETYNKQWGNVNNYIEKASTFNPLFITHTIERGYLKNSNCIDNGKVVKLQNIKQFKKMYLKKLGIINDFKNVDTIIELGAGWGRMIFTILEKFNIDKKINIITGEFTEEGIATQQNIKNKFKKDLNMEILHLDYENSKPFFDVLRNRQLGNVLFLSFWSIEQVTNIPDSFMDNILNCCNNFTCINIEPIGWQISEKCILKEFKKGYRNYYNKNFFNVLKKYEKNQLISIDDVKVDYYCPCWIGSQAIGTLIRWHKKNVN
tara:strand:+ start:27 stop:857 length:831 start_codon:yes stop_codon:yes gene_type:complete